LCCSIKGFKDFKYINYKSIKTIYLLIIIVNFAAEKKAAMNNNETLTIPTGTNREDIKERERITSDVYRRWYEENHRSYFSKIHNM